MKLKTEGEADVMPHASACTNTEVNTGAVWRCSTNAVNLLKLSQTDFNEFKVS
jgi:hypothetical protein